MQMVSHLHAVVIPVACLASGPRTIRPSDLGSLGARFRNLLRCQLDISLRFVTYGKMVGFSWLAAGDGRGLPLFLLVADESRGVAGNYIRWVVLLTAPRGLSGANLAGHWGFSS